MYLLNNQSKSKVWIDEAGNSIPLSHIKPSEKVNEKVTASIANEAIKVSEKLKAFRVLCTELTESAFQAFIKDYNGSKETFKGNITVFNFDRSVKVEVRVTEGIKFDEMIISQAKLKLEEFLKDGISAQNAVVKDMVLEAFSTARGKLDVKKILGLKRYADRVDDPRYQEAMKLIGQAIRRPDSATYYRVWVKNERKAYEAIPLALADV